MAKFTVTWRGDHDEFIITTVELEDSVDPKILSTNTWADLAWEAENRAAGLPEDEWGPRPSDNGYDLISVIVGVPEYIY